MRNVSLDVKRKTYDALQAIGDPKRVNEFYAELIGRTVSSHVAGGDIVVDAGAFHGRQTLALAAAVGPGGRVFAFEPLQPAFVVLSTQLRRHGFEDAVQAHQLAVSDHEGDMPFHHIHQAPGRSGRIWEGSPTERAGGFTATELRVPVARLDTVVGGSGPVRLMHLDLEGGELAALRGAVGLLARDRPLLLFRNSRGVAASMFGYDADAFCGFFDAAGYELFNVLGFRFQQRDWTTGRQPGWYLGVPAEDEVAKGTLHGMIDDVAAQHGLAAIFA